MNLSAISHIIQAHIIFIILLTVYHFMLKNDTRFKFNRFYLLSIFIFSISIPFIQLPVFSQTTILTFPALSDFAGTSSAEDTNAGFYISLSGKIAIAYAIICLILLAKSGYGMLKLSKHIKGIKNSAKYDKARDIYIIEGKLAPFSFLKWSFIPQSVLKKEGSELIIAHEKLHGRELHTLDIIVAEVAGCILFLNPLNKLYKKHITENHEYRADEVASKNDTHSKYQSLLIEHTLYPAHLQMVSSFAKPLILNRLIMMKKRKKTIANQTVAVLTTLLVLSLFACETQESEEIVINAEKNDKTITSDVDHVFTIVEDQAEPKNGIDDFYDFISANLNYPKQAQRLGVEGVVYLQFVIEKDGSLSNITAVKGIGAGCDQAAIDVLAASENWIPGKQAGKTVRSQRVIPIRFTLN